MKCTIKDIAESLGMSRNTVAKVLNNSPGVSAKTRQLVLDKAREMNYRSSPAVSQPAGIFPTQPQGAILFLTKASVNYSDFWFNVMRGIESELKKYNYTLVVGIMDNQDLETLTFPNIIHNIDIKGIILVEICDVRVCKAVLDFHLPTVTVDMPRDYEELLGKIDIITMENKIHIREIVECLIQKGCRNFSFAGNLSGNNVSRGFQERYDALNETLQANGLALMESAAFTTESDQQFLNLSYLIDKLKNMKELPDAYICGNDWTAIQLSNALQFLGYQIPKDISIVGFDNINASANVIPPLTTINTPKEQLGSAAGLCLVNRINNPHAPYVYSQYMSNLIIRESTI